MSPCVGIFRGTGVKVRVSKRVKVSARVRVSKKVRMRMRVRVQGGASHCEDAGHGWGKVETKGDDKDLKVWV